MCEPAPVELDIGRPMDTALPADNCSSAVQSTQECDADISPATENTDSCDGMFVVLSAVFDFWVVKTVHFSGPVNRSKRHRLTTSLDCVLHL